MMVKSPRSIRWSVRIYEKLIRAYPAEFRRKFAREMTLVFRELASDALRRKGLLGLFWAWCRVLGDLPYSASQEHFAALQRRILMKTAFRTFFWSLLAAFIHYFVFLSLGVLAIGLIFFFQGGSWLERSHNNAFSLLEIAIFIPPPFLAGMILARVQPFFRPYLTAPLGIVMIGLVVTLADAASNSSPWNGWYILGGIGVTAALGLETLLGCIAATKLSERFSKLRSVQRETTGVMIA
jgi:hypothetical protein